MMNMTLNTTEKLDTVDLFGALSNEVRQRMLMLMNTNGEICVCEFVDALSIAQPSASKALRTLKEAGVIEDRRDANWTYYKLREQLPTLTAQVLSATFEHLSKHAICLQDQSDFESISLDKDRDQICN